MSIRLQKTRIGRAEREISVPVLHRNYFSRALSTRLSRQLLILRIKMSALLAPYRAMPCTAAGR
jgi:hypothetical protein